MIPRAWRAILLSGLAGTPAWGQQTSADPHRFLTAVVRPYVVSDLGTEQKPSLVLIRAVDLNGSIRVKLDRDSMSRYVLPDSGPPADTARQTAIFALLRDLAAYSGLADTLAQSVIRGGAAFDSASARAGRWLIDYSLHLTSYFAARVGTVPAGANARLAVAQAAQPYAARDSMPALVRLVRADLARMVEEARRAQLGYGSLQIIAYRITDANDSVRLKVPGYDSIPGQAAAAIRKVTTTPTPKELAAFRLADSVSKSVRNVGDLAAYAFGDYLRAAREIAAAATELVDALRDAEDSLRVGVNRATLAATTDETFRQAARLVDEDLSAAFTALRRIVTQGRTLQTGLRGALTAPAVDAATLVEAIASLGSAAAEIKPLIDTAGILAIRIQNRLDSLARAAPAIDVWRVAGVAFVPLRRVVTAFTRLRNVFDEKARFVASDGRNLPAIAAAFSEDERRRLKLIPQPVGTAPDAEIALTRAGVERTEGDRVVVRADLVGPDGGVASREWWFHIEKLGWSSRFAAGIGFAGRIPSATNQKLRPIPVLAWVLRYRSHGESQSARFQNFLDPSLGLHVATFTSDSVPIQLGVGVSVNLLQDFLQGGIGRKLQPASHDDRWYWYVGLGLFKLATAIKS